MQGRFLRYDRRAVQGSPPLGSPTHPPPRPLRPKNPAFRPNLMARAISIEHVIRTRYDSKRNYDRDDIRRGRRRIDERESSRRSGAGRDCGNAGR